MPSDRKQFAEWFSGFTNWLCPTCGRGILAAPELETSPVPLQIVEGVRSESAFVIQPRRWIVERTFVWLGRKRRFRKDANSITAAGFPLRCRRHASSPAQRSALMTSRVDLTLGLRRRDLPTSRRKRGDGPVLL